MEKLLRAKNFQEAIRIEVDYFQSQLKAAAEDASQIGAKMASAFKPPGRALANVLLRARWLEADWVKVKNRKHRRWIG
jgi:hypothetical protein